MKDEEHAAILKRLGYELVDTFGDQLGGGFGLVYKVKKTGSNEYFAAKLLRPHVAKMAKVMEAFRQEANHWISLKPTNKEIERIYQNDEHLIGYKNIASADANPTDRATQNTYLIIEFVEGMSLRDLRKKEGYLSVSQTLDFGIQFCNGMIFCLYKRPAFIHRDIKPDNIMITKQKVLKIIDFGLSKSIGFKTGLSTHFQPGTPDYMAPEHFKGQKITERTDIFSFGITMLEMLGAYRKAPCANFLLREKNVPVELIDLLKKCTHRFSTKRVESFNSLRNELLKIQEKIRSGEIQVIDKKICALCNYIPNCNAAECPLCGGYLQEISKQAPIDSVHFCPDPTPSPIDVNGNHDQVLNDDSTFIEPVPGKFCLIKAGKFMKGCLEECADFLVKKYGLKISDKDVLLKNQWERQEIKYDFSISKYPVTNREYWEFVKASSYSVPPHWDNTKTPPYPEGMDHFPVVNVNWYDAHTFCQWAGYRLPLDDEWERAARGKNGRAYPWGNDFDNRKCNSAESGTGGPVSVLEHENGKSPDHAYQMTGNVWEWVEPSRFINCGLRGGSFAEPCEMAGLSFIKALKIDRSHKQENVGFRIVVPCGPGRQRKEIKIKNHSLILIPEGPFLKGCPKHEVNRIKKLARGFGFVPDAFIKAHAETRLFLPSYYISKFAVTQEEYNRFLGASGSRSNALDGRTGSAPFDGCGKNLPVVNVSLEDALDYCRWIGASSRLPSGDEWEKAARGDDGRLYPWGNTFDASQCNCAESGPPGAKPVDAHERGRSLYGVYNMAGNVQEIVCDVKHIRGGSYKASCELYGLTSFFMETDPDHRQDDIGFRCVKR